MIWLFFQTLDIGQYTDKHHDWKIDNSMISFAHTSHVYIWQETVPTVKLVINNSGEYGENTQWHAQWNSCSSQFFDWWESIRLVAWLCRNCWRTVVLVKSLCAKNHLKRRDGGAQRIQDSRHKLDASGALPLQWRQFRSKTEWIKVPIWVAIRRRTAHMMAVLKRWIRSDTSMTETTRWEIEWIRAHPWVGDRRRRTMQTWHQSSTGWIRSCTSMVRIFEWTQKLHLFRYDWNQSVLQCTV